MFDTSKSSKHNYLAFHVLLNTKKKNPIGLFSQKI